MTAASARWMIAYDATCGTCRRISLAVRQASANKLDVVPLDRPAVQDWRRQALGDDAPWAPTLLRIDGGMARAWTGPAIAYPLIRLLGAKETVNVVYALGQLRHSQNESASTWRRRLDFIARFWGGAVLAAGLLLTGKPPMSAAREKSDALRWVNKNRDRLPRTYDEIMTYPPAYQIAIFTASSPQTQSHFWVEALKRERDSRDGLTDEQRRVFDDAIELAGFDQIFTSGQVELDAELDRRLTSLHKRALSEFATRGDYGIFMKFGRVRA